jgi:D-alanyl-D-alanine-carboxypeptidase/D-alanyl-D-alanine-endopeptidase
LEPQVSGALYLLIKIVVHTILRPMWGRLFFLFSCFVLSARAFGDIDATVHQIFDPAMNPQAPTKAPVGLIVGVITRDGFRKVYGWGATTLGGASTPDGDTLVEVASITKTFTATLLAQAVIDGKIALNSPISNSDCDAETVSAFCFKGTPNTYLNLATHTAGFPATIPGGEDLDYFSRQDVDQYLSTFKLRGAPGKAYYYSNLGYGYLADLISDQEGETFNELVEDQITSVLGMSDTKVVLSGNELLEMNPGYSAGLTTLPDYAPERLYDFTDQSGLAGSAAVHSTANDLLTFLSSAMGITQSPLSDAMALAQIPRFSHAPDKRALAVGLGWEMLVDEHITFHSGDLPGFDSFMGYNTQTGVGVVVLSNTSLYASVGGRLDYYDQSTDLGVQFLLAQTILN